jgi:hypothetical protein
MLLNREYMHLTNGLQRSVSSSSSPLQLATTPGSVIFGMQSNLGFAGVSFG